MTVRQMYKKYIKIAKDNYELVTVNEVINDLHQIVMDMNIRNAKKIGKVI